MSTEHEESGQQQPPSKSKFQGRPVFLLRVVGMVAVSMLLILVWSGCDVAETSTIGLQPGDSAPPILANGWLNGEPLTPEDLKGKVVVLNAWFSQ